MAGRSDSRNTCGTIERLQINTISEVSLSSEVTSLKLQLMIMKDIQECVEIKMFKRFRSVTKVLTRSQNYKNLEPTANDIFKNYELIKTKLREVRSKVQEFIIRAEKGKFGQRSIAENISTDSPFFRLSLTTILDDEKVCKSLSVLVKILDDIKKENRRLTVNNRRLTHELKEITDTNLGRRLTEGKIIFYDADDPTIDQKKEEDSTPKDLKDIPYLFLAKKSFSQELFNPANASLIIRESEMKILTEEDWKIGLARLKKNNEAMLITEMKLATVKSMAKYGGF